MRIAIMQPYFIPYPGYFRLFAVADLFVIYDCVQFIRRGWLHRNKLTNARNEQQWLTLPLKKAPQDVLIKDLVFSENADDEWNSRLNSFPQLNTAEFQKNELSSCIGPLNSSPLDFIISSIKKICTILNLPCTVMKSSEFNIPVTLKGQERIIEIARKAKAKSYVNLSGGRNLYQADIFTYHGLKLEFLSEYQGSYESILQRLIDHDSKMIRHEIIEQSKLG